MSNHSYQLAGHTADVRLKIEGKTQEKLFMSALDGMDEIIKRGFCKDLDKPQLRQVISIKSSDLTNLLIDFLSEILTLSHENKAVFCKVKFLRLAKTFLHAEILGTKVDRFDRDIKAVTYHEAEVKKNESGKLQAMIVFDI